jgi:hypothetical protein
MIHHDLYGALSRTQSATFLYLFCTYFWHVSPLCIFWIFPSPLRVCVLPVLFGKLLMDLGQIRFGGLSWSVLHNLVLPRTTLAPSFHAALFADRSQIGQ